MSKLKTKWPLHEYDVNWKYRINRTIYMNRTTELLLDTSKCKACKQCAKACPKDALVMPVIPKGTKVEFVERMPIMPEPGKCVFCGVCMTLCPYDAISMKVDGEIQAVKDLKLKKGGIIPEITAVKLRKVEQVDETFSNPFWAKTLEKIAQK